LTSGGTITPMVAGFVFSSTFTSTRPR
jgi:hypothetical protein